jgi:hypothetical protein
MLIRSQDKESLINFNNSIVVNTMVDIGGVTKMFCSYSCDDYVIGHYSSKEKAMKVLDMIQEAYMEYKSGEIVGNGLAGSAYIGSYNTKESVAHGIAVLKGFGNEIRKSILFQMPADSEVEA